MKISARVLFCLALATAPAGAADINQNGQIGGLNLPTARSLDAGSLYAGIGAGAPYRNLYVGIQPIDALRITIRQQQDDRTEFTYPGIDVQVQLTEEGEWMPAAALGYTHIAGQRRFGGEYLVMSKRWWDFDFNMGVGWGRYANHGMLKNPFAAGSSRYEDAARDIGLGSTGPGAWYKGDRMGLFGSVTYDTPLDGLKLIAEYDRDPYFQEKLEGKLSRRAPFNIGARYEPWEGINITLAAYNLARAQLNISYAFNFQDDAKKKLAIADIRGMVPAPLPEGDEIQADLRQMEQLAWRQRVDILMSERRQGDTNIYLRYRAGEEPPYATYLGRAAYAAAEQAENEITSITLVPEYQGLTAGTYTMVRRDLVQATHFSGSTEEILHSATITRAEIEDQSLLNEQPKRDWKFFTEERFDNTVYEFGNLFLTRARFIVGTTYEPFNGITLGAAGGVESGDNLPLLPQSGKPVRTNLAEYTRNGADIDRLYLNAMHSIAPGVHARVTAGLLEEMYRGVSAEVLYQPHEARWAIGAEGNWLQQRDPRDSFQKTDYETQTGALSFYYEVPPRDLAVIVRAEQFLAKDQGVSLELRHQFQQGAHAGFKASYSGRRDFGGPEDRGHLDARMYMRIPLQFAVDDVPIYNYTTVNVGSLTRDSNQQVELSVRLWDVTRPVSYGPILRSWDDLLNF